MDFKKGISIFILVYYFAGIDLNKVSASFLGFGECTQCCELLRTEGIFNNNVEEQVDKCKSSGCNPNFGDDCTLAGDSSADQLACRVGLAFRQGLQTEKVSTEQEGLKRFGCLPKGVLTEIPLSFNRCHACCDKAEEFGYFVLNTNVKVSRCKELGCNEDDIICETSSAAAGYRTACSVGRSFKNNKPSIKKPNEDDEVLSYTCLPNGLIVDSATILDGVDEFPTFAPTPPPVIQRTVAPSPDNEPVVFDSRGSEMDWGALIAWVICGLIFFFFLGCCVNWLFCKDGRHACWQRQQQGENRNVGDQYIVSNYNDNGAGDELHNSDQGTEPDQDDKEYNIGQAVTAFFHGVDQRMVDSESEPGMRDRYSHARSKDSLYINSFSTSKSKENQDVEEGLVLDDDDEKETESFHPVHNDHVPMVSLTKTLPETDNVSEHDFDQRMRKSVRNRISVLDKMEDEIEEDSRSNLSENDKSTVFEPEDDVARLYHEQDDSWLDLNPPPVAVAQSLPVLPPRRNIELSQSQQTELVQEDVKALSENRSTLQEESMIAYQKSENSGSSNPSYASVAEEERRKSNNTDTDVVEEMKGEEAMMMKNQNRWSEPSYVEEVQHDEALKKQKYLFEPPYYEPPARRISNPRNDSESGSGLFNMVKNLFSRFSLKRNSGTSENSVNTEYSSDSSNYTENSEELIQEAFRQSNRITTDVVENGEDSVQEEEEISITPEISISENTIEPANFNIDKLNSVQRSEENVTDAEVQSHNSGDSVESLNETDREQIRFLASCYEDSIRNINELSDKESVVSTDSVFINEKYLDTNSIDSADKEPVAKKSFFSNPFKSRRILKPVQIENGVQNLESDVVIETTLKDSEGRWSSGTNEKDVFNKAYPEDPYASIVAVDETFSEHDDQDHEAKLQALLEAQHAITNNSENDDQLIEVDFDSSIHSENNGQIKSALAEEKYESIYNGEKSYEPVYEYDPNITMENDREEAYDNEETKFVSVPGEVEVHNVKSTEFRGILERIQEKLLHGHDPPVEGGHVHDDDYDNNSDVSTNDFQDHGVTPHGQTFDVEAPQFNDQGLPQSKTAYTNPHGSSVEVFNVKSPELRKSTLERLLFKRR